jgi:hypothetical protein
MGSADECGWVGGEYFQSSVYEFMSLPSYYFLPGHLVSLLRTLKASHSARDVWIAQALSQL